jgi:hypothetical protein
MGRIKNKKNIWEKLQLDASTIKSVLCKNYVLTSKISYKETATNNRNQGILIYDFSDGCMHAPIFGIRQL